MLYPLVQAACRHVCQEVHDKDLTQDPPHFNLSCFHGARPMQLSLMVQFTLWEPFVIRGIAGPQGKLVMGLESSPCQFASGFY